MKDIFKFFALFCLSALVPFGLIGSISGFVFDVTKWSFGQLEMYIVSSVGCFIGCLFLAFGKDIELY